MTNPVAVFVDGDNLSSGYASVILNKAQQAGTPGIARAYANTTALKGWADTPGFRTVVTGPGCGATDMCLALEALEVSMTTSVSTIFLCTSDGDFTPLALRLREMGRTVVGLGEDKAPNLFRSACHRFTVLGPEKQPRKAGPEPAPLDRKIRDLVARNSGNGKGMPMQALGVQLYRSGETLKQRPEKTWRAYLSQRSALYDLDPRGNEARVRIRHDGFANAKP
jgi:hypothetical protein